MKQINIVYWTLTGVFAGLMVITSIPSLICLPTAIKFMTLLGYPSYIIPFLAVAKILDGIALLVPGISRIKEWAYPGFAIDLVGVTYSQIMMLHFSVSIAFMVPLYLLFEGS